MQKNQGMKHLRDTLIIFCISQVCFLLICAWALHLSLLGIDDFLGYHTAHTKGISIVLLFVSSSLAIAMIYMCREFYKISLLEQELVVTRVANELNENTLKILRSHRHDFLNHMQVIVGYLQLNRTQNAIEYILNLSTELNNALPVNGLGMSEVAVVLINKQEEAARYGIKLKYFINASIRSNEINSIDMVRIISNLIDNAIYELKNNHYNEQTEKCIELSFDCRDEKIMVQVRNYPGAAINKDIFNYGFTTKGPEGSGIGLYTVKKLVVEKYNGTIEVTFSAETGTTFALTF